MPTSSRPTDPSGPLPLTYISFPSAKDPDRDRRHPGRATIEAVGLLRDIVRRAS